jgi:hypothetical protein
MHVESAIETGFNSTIAEMKEKCITAANSVIWNKGKFKETQRFLCEPEGYNPSILSNYQNEQLQLYKAWCAFAHNEYTKNKLCVLEEISKKIMGPVQQYRTDFSGYFP